jgi:hypothetical protein
VGIYLPPFKLRFPQRRQTINEQVTINTAKKISKNIGYKVLNKIDSCYLVTETNSRIEKKLKDIIVRFENGERGFHLE